MLKIRQSRDCLIFNMGIPILARRHLYIETVPEGPFQYKDVIIQYANGMELDLSKTEQNVQHFAYNIFKCLF